MVQITLYQERGQLKVLFAGNFAQAKAWVRDAFGSAKARYRESDWLEPCDEQMTYHQHKAGNPAYPAAPAVTGPVAIRFFGESTMINSQTLSGAPR